MPVPISRPRTTASPIRSSAHCAPRAAPTTRASTSPTDGTGNTSNTANASSGDGSAQAAAGGGLQGGGLPGLTIALRVSGVVLLNTLSEVLASGGGFVSVLSFEPMVVQAGTPFTTQLPANTFFHSDPSAAVILEATLPDGSPLPDWLIFDQDARSFHINAPEDTELLEVLITARDAAGHRAQTRLVLRFTKKR